MKKLRQFKALFITLDMVQEMPQDATFANRFPSGCLYVSADKIVRENISDTYLLDLLAQVELKGSEISNIVNLSWSREDVDSDEALQVNGAKILRILKNGIVIEGMKGTYSRFLRTPSQSRAGGAWLSNNPAKLREIISFGLENKYTTDFEVVPSKWDASLSLCCTTSTPVSLGREIKVQIIPDLYREIKTTVTTVETDDKAPNPLNEENTKGMVYRLLSNSKSKKFNNPDIEYAITTKERMTEICLGDGNALGTPFMFEVAGRSMQMNPAEMEHFQLAQFRGLPGCKGTITKFDINGFCEENDITEMRNIYGEKFDPRECDIIMYESCCKWADRFTSMEEYYNKTIRATFNVARKHSQFYIKAKNVIKPRINARIARLEKEYGVQEILSAVVDYANGKTPSEPVQIKSACFKRERGSRKLPTVKVESGKFVQYTEAIPYFKDHAVLRIANISKEHDEYHKLTYQYLQSLLKLDVDGLIPLTKPVYEAVKDCTTDLTVAKALWGMVHDDDADRYSRSLVSKATELVELKQELFNSRFVQKRIISTMRNLVQDQKRGAVMCKGGYHFIVPEPLIFFYQKGIKRVKNKAGKFTGKWYVPTLKPKTKLGLLQDGESYLADQSGISLGFRSPLIHASEVARLNFVDGTQNEMIEKWYGHLTGVILFNCYDSTAMRMGGADYDGDKIYLLDSSADENKVIIDNYQPDLPLIVSPLENLSAKKYQVSQAVMLEVDERTLQNYTGIYTNMGTYYQNLKYHVFYRLGRLLEYLRTGNAEFWKDFVEVMPKETWGNYPLESLSYNQLESMITDELCAVNDRCEYCITLIRIAQAGEIDFTKHGTRFALPMNVEVFSSLHWLKDYTMPSHGTNTRPGEYGMTEVFWFEDMKEKVLLKMDTPMQRLCDDVDSYYKTAIAHINENAHVDTMSLFLGDNFIIPASVNAIYDKVCAIATEFGLALSKLRVETRNLSAEESTKRYRVVYTKYTDMCAQFTDRKALAIAGLYFEVQTDSKSNFAFICCYDGLVELLLEQPTVSPRIARVKLPKWVDAIHVDTVGKVGYAYDGTYKTHTIALPFIATDCQIEVKDAKVETVDINTGNIVETNVSLEDGSYTYTDGKFIIFNKEAIQLPTTLNPGTYPIKEYFGKTYISFGYMLDDASRKELADAHYNNRTEQGRAVRDENGAVVSREHVVEIVAGKRDKFIITGMSRVKDDNGNPMPTNAVEVAELIKEYKGQCMVVERTKDDGTTAPMLSIGGRIVGMISTKDNLKVKKDYTINYRQMYGHVFRLSVTGALRKTDGTALGSLEVLARVESVVPFTNPINKVHANCDLSKWYWNVEWKTFKEFGYNFKNMNFIGKPVVGNVFADITLEVNGSEMHVAVARVEGEVPLQITSISCMGQEYDINSFGKDFEAVVFRAVSFFYAKQGM